MPARIDTQMLYDGEGEDGLQDASDDEEALKVSYASIMGRLKVPSFPSPLSNSMYYGIFPGM